MIFSLTYIFFLLCFFYHASTSKTTPYLNTPDRQIHKNNMDSIDFSDILMLALVFAVTLLVLSAVLFHLDVIPSWEDNPFLLCSLAWLTTNACMNVALIGTIHIMYVGFSLYLWLLYVVAAVYFKPIPIVH